MRRPFRVGRADREGADLGVVGTVRRAPRSRTWPAASVQALCPSAASGLIVRPGGQGDDHGPDLRRGGGEALELGSAQFKFKPDAESVSLVVGSPASTGLKISFSQPSIAG